MKANAKINPEDYIFSILSPDERLAAAFNIAQDVFKKTSLTIQDIEKSIKKVRGKNYDKAKK